MSTDPLPSGDEASKVERVMYGERLLPQVVDEHARTHPERVYASYAISTDLNQGFRDVTMLEMARAVNHCAWWMNERLGSPANFETLAYMGAFDVRYPILCLAGIKCGWKILLLGPRNAVVQNQNLLERTKCSKLLYSVEMTVTAENLRRETLHVVSVEVQQLDDMLSAMPHPFPFDKKFSEAQRDPILILHSSGSTGNPKLITMTHGTFSVTDNDRKMPTPEGRKPQNAAQFDFEGGGRFYTCFPPYHLAGTQALLVLPIFSTTATIVLGPSTLPPSGHLMSEVIRQQKQKIRAIYVPPLIIEQWARDPAALEQAKEMNFVLYGGGPLAPAVGDLLDQVTDVCQMYGSAETGQIQLLVPQKGEWAYMEWNPYEEIDMQPSNEEAFEMVLHQDQKFSKHRSLFHNFPNIKEWRTGDLFVPHPTKVGLWRFHARVDDLILLSNGHKINPIAVESVLLGHPLLSGAVVVGTGRSQPALLLEIKSSVHLSERQSAVEQIWPTIQKANLIAPAYGQISRSKVVLSDPSKTFFRTPKGTIIRRWTIDAYSAEIDSVFYESSSDCQAAVLKHTSLHEMTHFVREVLTDILPMADLDDNTDLFNLGLDSLKIVELVDGLRHGLKDHKELNQPQLSTRTVYQHPTISMLASSLYPSMSPSEDYHLEPETRNQINELVRKYTQTLPLVAFQNIVEPREGLNVILTGSTGSLGSNVLYVLLQSSQISKVYCLVRSEGAVQKLEKKLASTGIPQNLYSCKIETIYIDLAENRMGLSDQTYKSLLVSADMIIHTAWKVDFNLTLGFYEAHHLHGLRSLIDFSIASERHPRIVFTSSTSFAIDWAAAHARVTVPEDLLISSCNVSNTGYGESKQVAEGVLATASNRCKIPVTILRIGQIAGSTSESGGGLWPKREWVPSLMETSTILNLIPSANFSIDWIPVGDLAHIICDITLCTNVFNGRDIDDSRLQIYNLVNPVTTPWATFTKLLTRKMTSAKVVPLAAWVEAIASHDATSYAELKRMPALKMLTFFQALAEREKQRGEGKHLHFVTEKAIAGSKAMAELQPISETLLERWISHLM